MSSDFEQGFIFAMQICNIVFGRQPSRKDLIAVLEDIASGDMTLQSTMPDIVAAIEHRHQIKLPEDFGQSLMKLLDDLGDPANHGQIDLICRNNAERILRFFGER